MDHWSEATNMTEDEIKEQYAKLINEWLPEPGRFLGKEIAAISTITEGDVERLAKGILDNHPLVPVLILDRINKPE